MQELMIQEKTQKCWFYKQTNDWINKNTWTN